MIILGTLSNNLVSFTLLFNLSQRSLYRVVEKRDNIISYIIKTPTPYKYSIALANNLLNIISTIILRKSKKRIRIKKAKNKLSKLEVLIIIKKK